MLAAAIFVKRERDLINAIFRVVDSVARFLYKIYNCVLDNPALDTKGLWMVCN